MSAADPGQENLREALKRVAVALKQTGRPFALMGGYAAWARGGPESGHDVDVIHRVTGRAATRDVVEEADELEVLSVLMPVLSATEILVQKMHVLSEHHCDLSEYVPVARSLREQVDWTRVRAETAANPYAEALLFLLERIEVVEPLPV